MRNTALILFLFVVGATAGNSQTKRVTFAADRMTTGDVLDEIEQQTDYLFIYNEDDVDVKRTVDVDEGTHPVSEVLDDMFAGTDTRYVMEGKSIMLLSDAKVDAIVQQRNVRVTGVVKDATDEPIIGANITVKGQQTGTITDIDGRFAIEVPANAVLVVSYIGFTTQEVPTAGKRELVITLKEDSGLLDEVVVVGYGTARKRDLTGSVIQVKATQLAAEAPKTVQDLLRGTAGLEIGYSYSAKGGGSLEVRGQRSVYTDNDHNAPLIILDGMMFYGELSEINPSDIEQIDVLKDASAAAVYGAKSANGVIIVTTKKGREGKPIINFKADWGFVTMGNNHRTVYGPKGYMKYRRDFYVADTYGTDETTGEYTEYADGTSIGYYEEPTSANFTKYGITRDEWRDYSGASDDMSDYEVWATRLGLTSDALDNYLSGYTFDWYDHSFRVGLNQNYTVSASGATPRINYYLSFGYMRNQGLAQGDDYTTFRTNFKLSSKITDWFEIGANVNFQERTDDDNAVDWETQILKNSPFATYKDSDGNLVNYPMGNVSGNSGYNYDYEQQWYEQETGYTVLNTIINATVKLPFGIRYDFNIAPRFQWYYYRDFHSADDPDATASYANRNNGKRFDWSLNNTLTWDKTFDEKHHFTVTLVQEAEERRSWSDYIYAYDFEPTDALGFHYVQSADSDNSTISSTDTHETADGMLARLFYSYDDRYMFTGSFRRDGYCAFGSNNKRANFFSASVAWTFTNEEFFNWKPMSYGKLRISWGQNGNRSLSDVYTALANLGRGAGALYGYYNTSSGDIDEYVYLMMSRLANTNLKWERTSSLNIGLDFGFFNDRLTGSLEYYHMPTNDMIMSQSIPSFTGFSSITTNLGEVVNDGFEISLNSTNIKTKNFEWDSSFTFSYNKNRIKHLYYEYDEDGVEEDDSSNGWFIGQPINVIWNYKTTGIWQIDQVEEAAEYGQRPGDPIVWNNTSNDSSGITYDNEDKVFLGQTDPKFNWSLRNNFKYKDFSLSVSMYSKMGHKSTGTSYLNQDNSGSKFSYGWNTYQKNYWTIDNPTSDYARLNAQGPSGVTSPVKIYNKGFIRVESVTLSYNLPKKLLNRWGINQLTLNGSIRNAYVFAFDKTIRKERWDPETDWLAPRTFNLGINITL